jgi:hypothetical protein
VRRGSYHPASHQRGIDDPDRSSPERTYGLTLEPVYAWFTEGFDTPDLKEAAALLDELR